eukprot:3225042-Rhodomonas_salina.1
MHLTRSVVLCVSSRHVWSCSEPCSCHPISPLLPPLLPWTSSTTLSPGATSPCLACPKPAHARAVQASGIPGRGWTGWMGCIAATSERKEAARQGWDPGAQH